MAKKSAQSLYDELYNTLSGAHGIVTCAQYVDDVPSPVSMALTAAAEMLHEALVNLTESGEVFGYKEKTHD
jgi:hypothetical protein